MKKGTCLKGTSPFSERTDSMATAAVPSDVKERQYASKVVNFSSQYGGNNKAYSAANLAGPTSRYPSYGDFTEAFVLRTYGSWWLKAPSAPKSIATQPAHFLSQDFVELEYKMPVIPTEVIIYETYNPGTVVRILACNASSGSAISSSQVRWEELWSGPPQDKDIPRSERSFHPPIKTINFATSLLRLEFNHSTVDYYTELDGVLLIGYKPSAPKQKPRDRALGFVLDRTTSLLEKMSLSNRINRQVSVESCHGDTEDLDNGYFDWLPDETIQQILGYLDVSSLCRAALCCRLLFHLAYDPFLMAWQNLDLQPYWTKVDTVALSSLELRCKHLHHLSLSWTGGGLQITEKAFSRFMRVCGSQLVCLRLACCQFVQKEAIVTIALVCKDLEELDLQACHLAGDSRVLEPLSKLKRIKFLNLYNTPVANDELLKIIQNNPDLQHLNVGSCVAISDCYVVLEYLARHCKGLLSLDLWRCRLLTSEGLDVLTDGCRQLRELDIGWTVHVAPLTLIRLAKRCTGLKKVFLTAIRSLNDEAVRGFADNCPELEQFDILGSNKISKDALEYLLRRCSKLVLFDVSFCSGIDDLSVTHFRQEFPNVSFKKSFSN